MNYKIFIDDSGSKEYFNPFSRDFIDNPPDTEQYLDFWRKNYFVLTGVRVLNKDLGLINKAINDLKEDIFKTHNVEIKSDWLRNPNQQKKHYLIPFKLKIEDLKKFGDKLFKLIIKYNQQLKIISVVFDKRYFGDKKRLIAEGNSLAKTSQIIFERVQYLGGKNTVIFDQMESSLKLRRGRHKLILDVFENKESIKTIHVHKYSAIDDVKFAKSNLENFLQIADICGYPVYRQFVHYGRDWGSKTNDTLPTYEYFNRIRHNFVSLKGKVRGVGLVCIPDLNKRNWDILNDCHLIKKTPPVR